MRWQGRRQSDNVEDRRGGPGPRVLAGGGLGTLVIILIVIFLGGDPIQILNQLAGPGGAPIAAPGRQQGAGQDDELKQFVSVVLADTEDVWGALFPKEFNREYRDPHLVLFSGQVASACGLASTASGPFYCPGDEQVYIDLEFCDELRSRFQAPGDFAVAYVLAHEVGHHVQKQLGYTDLVDRKRGRISQAEMNKLSVRLELQADYLAGVWAHYAQQMKNILDPGDTDEAIRAAKAVGDDRLQRQSQGYVVPDSFTHGTSEQRAHYFNLGYETGDLSKLDHFFTDPNL